ncbi:MAG TPA: hypothetical protein VI172_16010 [Candidatus Dormibacteraeota bacterium]|jgi:hypothetical protein
MSKTATFIKHIQGWRGDARLYRLSPPHEASPHVIVSATEVPYLGPETYIFPATDEGSIVSWSEMEGSYRGGLDHAQALRNAGYEILP